MATGAAPSVDDAVLDFALLFVAVLWLVAVLALFRESYEWREDHPVRAGVLAVALTWYTVVTTVPVVLITALLSI